MTTPEGPVAQERQALADLVNALGYAQSAGAVVDVLGTFPGVAADAVKLLLGLGPVRGLLRGSARSGSHPAQEAMRRQNLFRRAAYLVNAARRITLAWSGPRQGRQERTLAALRRERRYLQMHIDANAGRTRAAEAVVREAKNAARPEVRGTFEAPPGLLGWYAVMDEVTSSECVAANGRNFDPKRIPRIGFPGAVHPACRCKPGPPHPTDARVEDVRSGIADAVEGRRRVTEEIAASVPDWYVQAGWTATLGS